MGWFSDDGWDCLNGAGGSLSSAKEKKPLPKALELTVNDWAMVLRNAKEEYVEKWGEASDEDASQLLTWFANRDFLPQLQAFLQERSWESLEDVTEIVVALESAQRSLDSF